MCLFCFLILKLFFQILKPPWGSHVGDTCFLSVLSQSQHVFGLLRWAYLKKVSQHICVRYITCIHLRNKGNVVQKRLLLPYRLLYVCPFSRYPDTTDGFQKHDINETKAVQQGVCASWQLKWMGASWQMLIITVFRNWWSRSPSSRNRGGTEEMHTVPYLYV